MEESKMQIEISESDQLELLVVLRLYIFEHNGRSNPNNADTICLYERLAGVAYEDPN